MGFLVGGSMSFKVSKFRSTGAQVGDVKKVKRRRWGRGELESTHLQIRSRPLPPRLLIPRWKCGPNVPYFSLSFFFFLKGIHEFMLVCEVSQFLNAH